MKQTSGLLILSDIQFEMQFAEYKSVTFVGNGNKYRCKYEHIS